MDEEKISKLLSLSEEYSTLQRIIHACHLEYDDTSADETTRDAAAVYAAGQKLRGAMTAAEIQEFERRLRAKRRR